jgi:hypothetical protein
MAHLRMSRSAAKSLRDALNQAILATAPVPESLKN